MVRHFLGVIFWSFISVVVFINLFQYSGAVLPFNDYFNGNDVNLSNSYFGFSSFFTLLQTIGNDTGITTGLTIMNQGVRVIQIFSVDDFASFFNNMRNLQTSNPGLAILYLLSGLFNLIKDILVLPVMAFVGIIMIIIGAITFIWQLLGIFFTFLLGGYNTPLVAVGNLPNAYMSAYAFY